MAMLRLALGLICLASATAASAEDWWHIGTDGETPTRQLGMVDADSIDWTDPAIPRVKLALWSETPDEAGVAVGIATYAIDCDAATIGITFIEIRDAQGAVMDAAPLDGAFEPINSDTYNELLHRAVCKEQWQWNGGFQFGKGKTLNELAGAVFPD
jgi:hypothetical protein